MTRVTSGAFIRELGRVRVMAHLESIVVTNHGCDDVVLVGAKDYAPLRRYDQSRCMSLGFPRKSWRSHACSGRKPISACRGRGQSVR
jgi:hypothetical protein